MRKFCRYSIFMIAKSFSTQWTVQLMDQQITIRTTLVNHSYFLKNLGLSNRSL